MCDLNDIVAVQDGDDWGDEPGREGTWLVFERPVEIVRAGCVAEVGAALERVERATRDEGLWAAGWIAYEAAPAFDAACCVRKTPTSGEARDAAVGPLVWFGLFDAAPRRIEGDPAGWRPGGAYRLGAWRPSIGREAFGDAVARVRRWIADGDTYQVNFTYRLRAAFEGDPWGWFLDLQRAQRGRYGAFVATGDRVVVSASPECFFTQRGDRVMSRPMKGTAPRGRWIEEDDAHAAALAASPKDQAENVMIVDLIRNDLGRVARTGSVDVARLFEIERYETVLQMTSTVTARTDVGPVETLAALFPCGSVTGAPKLRSMEIIAELETEPRGVYTGAVGWIGPGRRARFNVAIRTATLDRTSATVCYGVGGGITWGSDTEAEYRETRAKASVLTTRRDAFDLIETMRWDGDNEDDGGFYLLERHLARLMDSARYFGFALDARAVRDALERWATAAHSADIHGDPQRVRLLVARDGSVRIEAAPLPTPLDATAPRSVAFAPEPVSIDDPFLFHKTTRRALYDAARAARPEADDVLLWNERGEATESTTANLVAEIDGRRWTPSRTCGLLAGTLRAHLLDADEIAERTLTRDDVRRAHRLWLINSVRGWMPARWVETK